MIIWRTVKPSIVGESSGIFSRAHLDLGKNFTWPWTCTLSVNCVLHTACTRKHCVQNSERATFAVSIGCWQIVITSRNHQLSLEP